MKTPTPPLRPARAVVTAGAMTARQLFLVEARRGERNLVHPVRDLPSTAPQPRLPPMWCPAPHQWETAEPQPERFPLASARGAGHTNRPRWAAGPGLPACDPT
jgi:hypothetical protein